MTFAALRYRPANSVLRHFGVSYIYGIYRIATEEDLLRFAGEVNGGNTAIKGQLTTDIDLSGTAWPGIGTAAKPFAGSFDGQGHTVTFKDAGVGLFGYNMGKSGAVATVQNVITEGSIKASGFAMEAGFVHFTSCINRATDFTVKVNGEAVTAASNGKYTVLNVDGPLSVTVLGVQ